MLGKKNLNYITLAPHSIEVKDDGAPLQVIPLPENVINNLELIDEDALAKLVGDLVKAKAYQATEIIWVLNPATYFELKMPLSDKPNWETKKSQFLDSIPFEDVISKTYLDNAGITIVASNNDLISAFVDIFMKNGYTTKAIVPQSRFSNNISQLVKDSMLNQEQTKVANMPEISDKKDEKSKSSLPLLLAVFGVLIVILGIVIFVTR